MKQTKRQRMTKVPARPQVNPRKNFNQWKILIFICENDGCKAPYRHEHRLLYEE